MNELFALRLVGTILAGICAAFVARLVSRPTPKLAGRVRPYTAASRSVLGRLPDHAVVASDEPVTNRPQNVFQRLTRPLLESLTSTLTSVFGSAFDDEALANKLRQADVLTHVPEQDRVQEYRIRQVGAGLGYGLLIAIVALLLGLSPAACLGLFVVGAILGVARRSAGVERRIETKRDRMLVELYTINQLLAIYLRTSGSPVMAAQRLVRRGRGAVIDELDEALRLHTRGMSASKAFERIAEQTPEPFAARTYKLLASGSERGADLAAALLSLSDDIRDHRRTLVRRTATKRQAAVLLPIILLLAPVMLLFVAAPLPQMLFGGLR